MLKHAGLVVFVALLLSLSVFGQEPTLTLAGTDLKLGMSKEAVLSNLKNRSQLTKVNDIHPKDTWAVFANGDTPSKGGGAVSFTDGKLSVIQKQWGPFKGDLGGARLISTLSHILETEQKKGQYTVTIDAKRNVGPPGRSNIIRLVFSDVHKKSDNSVRKVLQLFVMEDPNVGIAYGLLEILEPDTKQTADLMEPARRDLK